LLVPGQGPEPELVPVLVLEQGQGLVRRSQLE